MRRAKRESTSTQVWLSALVLAVLLPYAGRAQVPELSTSQVPEPTIPAGTILTMFRHPDETKYWVSGQMNFIGQYHPPFYAAYSGTNSLQPQSEEVNSHVLTLYTGYEFTPSME